METVYTILVVDDEEPILAVLRRVLRPEGYHVITAQNPLEVMAILAKQSVDILLSDIEMPQCSGLDLTEMVRKEFPSVLRILLTGRTTTGGLLRAINDGQVFRYIEKPFDVPTLRAIIREAVAHLQSTRQAEKLLQRAHQREQLMTEIEREHPEILKTRVEEGAYVLEEARLEALAQLLDHPLGALCKVEGSKKLPSN